MKRGSTSRPGRRHVPPFLRRTLVLLEARRALARGRPEHVLELLRDESVTERPAARELREEALEALLVGARKRAEEGRESSFLRMLQTVATEDPGRAAAWRRESSPGWMEEDGMAPLESESALDAGSSALDALLGRVAPSTAAMQAAEAAVQSPAPDHPHVSLRFHMAVDDGGEFLVVAGEELTLGHARGGEADIPFLADLESAQATIRPVESFHGGTSWQLLPRARAAEVGGREAPVGEARELYDGVLVAISPRVQFRFRLPEPGSASAQLELLHGAEAGDAGRVILLVPGPAGRVRIGSRRRRHVPVRDLEQDVSLSLVEGQLEVACEGGVRIEGVSRNQEEASTNKRLPCPPPARIDLTVNARPSRRVPFGLSLSPFE